MLLAPLVMPLALWRIATLIYPDFFWVSLYPGGNNTDPTIITPGDSIIVSVHLVEDDDTAGIDLPDAQWWGVTVNITGDGYDTTLTLSYIRSYWDYVDGHYCYIAVFEPMALWTVPAGEGITYRFDWEVKIIEYDPLTGMSTLLGTATTTTYAKTPYEEPDGYFEIDDVEATETSIHITFDPTIKLDFVPTRHEAKITGVYVCIRQNGVVLDTVFLVVQADGTYSANYTFTDTGVYELRGWIKWLYGPDLRKMTITIGWGEETPPSPFWKTSVFAVVFIASGIALFVVQRRKP